MKRQLSVWNEKEIENRGKRLAEGRKCRTRGNH
jgi:hypothetical protein